MLIAAETLPPHPTRGVRPPPKPAVAKEAEPTPFVVSKQQKIEIDRKERAEAERLTEAKLAAEIEQHKIERKHRSIAIAQSKGKPGKHTKRMIDRTNRFASTGAGAGAGAGSDHSTYRDSKSAAAAAAASAAAPPPPPAPAVSVPLTSIPATLRLSHSAPSRNRGKRQNRKRGAERSEKRSVIAASNMFGVSDMPSKHTLRSESYRKWGARNRESREEINTRKRESQNRNEMIDAAFRMANERRHGDWRYELRLLLNGRRRRKYY